MIGFKLVNGDVAIENNAISMVEDNELTRQTAERVIQTNKGEWFLNEDEGIDFQSVLVKNPSYDNIRTEIGKALLSVDKTAIITKFEHSLDKERHLTIEFDSSIGKVNTTIG